MNTTSRLKESIESRTGNSRASQQRSDVFEEPNFLEIPESVQQRFESKGLTLRWVRVLLKGQDDYKNVGKRRAEGWEFVKSEDVPEMEHSSTVMETGRYVGAICRGDVALCHMSKARSESRQEFYENKSRKMVQTVNAQLYDAKNPFPVHTGSKTQVSRGKKAASFQD
jgi:hypothetical protein|tara:strand:+ start:8191 stop:8694 length:504 start_codon:yes stop_codon:yes gene_type:complete